MRRGWWAERRVAAILAVVNVAFVVLLAGKPSFTNASHPWLWGSPTLSLQFVRSVEDVDLILGNAPSPDREAMRVKTYIDFGFIASYTALGIVLARSLARAGGWRLAAAIAAAVCTLAAAVFDVLENRAILAVLDVPLRQTTAAMLNAIRGPAAAKWSLAGLAAVLLLAHFVKPRKRSS